MEGRNRRRQYIVDKDFQFKFIFGFCLKTALAALVVAGLIYYFSSGSTSLAIENTKVVVKRTQDLLLPVILGAAASVALIASLLMFVTTLLATHRMAGPVYRLNREVEKLKHGDLTRTFKIRSKDEFQSLAQNLHEMSEVLKRNTGELKIKIDELKSFLRQRNYSVPENEREVFLSKAKEIDTLINYFRV
jgi:methyl-accepting chemotaxis protein